MDKKTQMNITKLQMFEQKLQSVLMQKQTFQGQLLEVENALVELKGAETAYKIVGNIMLSYSESDLTKDLEEKKISLESRLKKLEVEEKKIAEDSSSIREELTEQMSKEKNE